MAVQIGSRLVETTPLIGLSAGLRTTLN